MNLLEDALQENIFWYSLVHKSCKKIYLALEIGSSKSVKVHALGVTEVSFTLILYFKIYLKKKDILYSNFLGYVLALHLGLFIFRTKSKR